VHNLLPQNTVVGVRRAATLALLNTQLLSAFPPFAAAAKGS